MRIYFSGGNGITTTPEALIPQLKPNVMVTFITMTDSKLVGQILPRINVFLARQTSRRLKRKLSKGRKGRQIIQK